MAQPLLSGTRGWRPPSAAVNKAALGTRVQNLSQARFQISGVQTQTWACRGPGRLCSVLGAPLCLPPRLRPLLPALPLLFPACWTTALPAGPPHLLPVLGCLFRSIVCFCSRGCSEPRVVWLRRFCSQTGLGPNPGLERALRQLPCCRIARGRAARPEDVTARGCSGGIRGRADAGALEPVRLCELGSQGSAGSPSALALGDMAARAPGPALLPALSPASAPREAGS